MSITTLRPCEFESVILPSWGTFTLLALGRVRGRTIGGGHSRRLHPARPERRAGPARGGDLPPGVAGDEPRRPRRDCCLIVKQAVGSRPPWGSSNAAPPTAGARPPLAVVLSRDRLQMVTLGSGLLRQSPAERAKLALRARRAKHQDLCLVLVFIEFAGKVGTPASRQLVAPSAALGAPKKRVCSSHPPVYLPAGTSG
jgi:hypothetical protein